MSFAFYQIKEFLKIDRTDEEASKITETHELLLSKHFVIVNNGQLITQNRFKIFKKQRFGKEDPRVSRFEDIYASSRF